MTDSDRARIAGFLMLGWVALLWLLEAVDTATGHALDAYGITARDTGDLPSVLTAPFIHFGWDHVAANSIPLLALGFLAALGGLRRFLLVCAVIIVADGLGVWLFSPSDSNTAGASGLVFGLFGYLVVRGFVERRPTGIIVGLLVAAIWGSAILSGIGPSDSSVSWQGHLIGLLAGAAVAFLLPKAPPGRAGVYG
ncbi:rhomboid family intramembrane serine protease [Streptomyces venezuelae]|uniref:Rhomboid family intramembrane serine protease n=1 Tax=Streptomyces venezuelae TaxID=54571 RepID=A0A5P2D4S0_STRVZ|nr:rhomboid family intramembrane serine protease [Streptomyces venezuelae]QES49550.1 rhomboid family intramembrane serine protease [Streptomyces venezuelae]